jgi:GNAT superfamily N-acetyltransferase
MIIREAAGHDRDILVKLRSLMLESMTGDSLPEDDVRLLEDYFGEWSGDEPLCLVAEEEGSVVGAIAVSFYSHLPGPGEPSGIRAMIHNLYVLPQHRGKGVGKRLVEETLKECGKRGVCRVSLYATDMGRPVFESFGFSGEPPRFPEMRLYKEGIEKLDL